MRPHLGRCATALLLISAAVASAQDRLKAMPIYAHYQQTQMLIQSATRFESPQPAWSSDGALLEYRTGGKWHRLDIAGNTDSEITSPSFRPAASQPARGRAARGRGPERGRQFASATSADGRYRAVYRDRNLVLVDLMDNNKESEITADGSVAGRIKNGSASWVYGEELDQTTAMWWSPDSTMLAYYRFDETGVPDYFLQLQQTTLHSRIDTEAYPLPGEQNPMAELFIFSVADHRTLKIDARDGKAFENGMGHYVYHVAWSADSKSLTFLRTNRSQNQMDFVAADPQSGKCRVIVSEQSAKSWVETIPIIYFLKDGQRFIWSSQESGFKNLKLCTLEESEPITLTKNAFDAEDVSTIVEKDNALFYLSHDGNNPMKLQLHRVKLDGTGDTRLTDPAFHHSVAVSPDGGHFVDTYQTHDTPPATRLCDADGKTIRELTKSNVEKLTKAGVEPVELLKFKSADGNTQLFGLLHKPSHFDPHKKYPMLVSIYAGPNTNAARELFVPPSSLTELGFLVASFDSRSAAGYGKGLTDAIYRNFGQAEIDDQAAGVKSLWDRSYVDRTHVGIFGTSYGGYASAMCLLRHPDVFAAASSSSPVTDFRDYDSIYTERYMGLPFDNVEGYKNASLMTYASKLRGRLMLYYGTADNNVHPNNTMQFVAALQEAGKSFDLQVGPDRGHSGLNTERMMEFFISNLGSAGGN